MGKMKQAFLYVSIMFLFICIYAYAEDNHNFSQLNQMIEVMTNEQIELDEWSVYMKEPIRDLDSVLTRLHDFSWEQVDTDTMKGTYEYPKIQMKEIVTLIETKHSLGYLLSYEVRGTSFSDDDLLQAKAIMKDNQQLLFTRDVQPFILVRGETNIEELRHADVLAQALLGNLHSEEVERLIEEDFLAVSAFRKDWPNTLVTGINKMNLQLAIRASNDFIGVKTVTLGTPIITIEY